jgi:hypothetical protein
MGRLLMLSTPAKVNVVGMVVAAGITIEYFSGSRGSPRSPRARSSWWGRRRWSPGAVALDGGRRGARTAP